MFKLFSQVYDLFFQYRMWWLFAFSHGMDGVAANENILNDFWDQESLKSFDQGSAPGAALVREESRPWGNASKVIFTSLVKTPRVENNLVSGRLFTPPGLEPLSGRPALLIIPGWLTQDYQQYVRICRRFLQQGFDCLVLAMPYHLERTPPGYFSGEAFFTPDLYQIMEAMEQSLSDCRLAVSWLLGSGASSVGVLGFDLGGLIGGLLTTLEPRLAFASLWAPISSLERALRHSNFYRPVKDRMFAAVIHWQDLSRCLEDFDPVRRRPVIDQGRIHFIQGTYDRIVRPSWVERWVAEWDRPEFLRVPHGHFSMLRDPRVINHAVELAKTDLNV
jgi:dienelactone hydrolase